MIDTICIWPDGTWCCYDDLEEYLTFMSDDFNKVVMNTSKINDIDVFVQDYIKHMR